MSSVVKVVVVANGNNEGFGFGRNSWLLPAHLANSGVVIARQVAQSLVSMLHGCIIFACSPLVRAQETLFAIMEELGIKPKDFDLAVWYERELWSGHPQTWYADIDPADYNNGVVFRQKPEAVLGEGELVFGAIQRVCKLTRLADQSISLCVSHSGPLGAAIMVAKHSLDECAEIRNLREGEGAIFFFEDDKLTRVDDLFRAS